MFLAGRMCVKICYNFKCNLGFYGNPISSYHPLKHLNTREAHIFNHVYFEFEILSFDHKLPVR